MHGLPRKLTVDVLARLFEGRTRVVERLAAVEDPLTHAHALLRVLPEEEQIEALNAHPRIGAIALSAASAQEQGGVEDAAILRELARLNDAYEKQFGFRFVIFANGRSKAQLLEVLRARLAHAREEELATGLAELVAIALNRYRRA